MGGGGQYTFCHLSGGGDGLFEKKNSGETGDGGREVGS